MCKRNSPSSYEIRLLTVALLAFLGCVTPMQTEAQQWTFEPVIRAGAEYDDNIRLRPDDDNVVDSGSLSLDGIGAIVRRSQSSEVKFIPRVRLRDFVEQEVEDLDDYFLDFFGRKETLKGSFGLQVRLSQENILRAEIENRDFDNPDVIDPIDIDTGQIRVGDVQERGNVSAFFNRSLTERVGFGLSARYLDVSYDGTSDLQDFSSAALRTELTLQSSQRSVWALGAFGGEFESEDETNFNESQTTGIDIGYRYRVGERTELRASAGYQNVKTDSTRNGVVRDFEDDLTVFELTWIRSGETSRLVANVSQSVDAGGFGSLQKRTQFRVRYTTALSQRVNARIEGRLQTIEPSGVQNPIDRDFSRIRVALERRLSRAWSIEGSYTFTSQEFSDQNTDSKSNAVALAVVFEPRRPQ